MTTSTSVPDGALMTWEEYAGLAEDPRHEYIDGRLVVSPGPSRRHQDICGALLTLLQPLLPPGWHITLGWAWKPGRDEFIPDAIVYGDTDDTARYTGRPALCIEVLSANRSDDLVVKATRYATAGLPAYWIVDPRDGELQAFALDGTTYRRVVHLGLDTEAGSGVPSASAITLALGEANVSVPVDLVSLLAC